MKIEKGKFYRLKNGQKAEIYAVHERNKTIHGVIYDNHGSLSLMAWTIDGAALPDLSIKGEWREKHPAEDWVRGTIVEVSNDQKKWYLRRFYNVCLDSPFPIVTFNDGCTLTLSHSKYARLPNEN